MTDCILWTFAVSIIKPWASDSLYEAPVGESKYIFQSCHVFPAAATATKLWSEASIGHDSICVTDRKEREELPWSSE